MSTERLTAWLRTQVPDADDVRIEGLDRVNFGHSAEMMMLTVVTRHGDRDNRQDVVLRLRPKPPALLEPYDLARQFTILRALAEHPGPCSPGAVARGHRRRARKTFLRDGTGRPATFTKWRRRPTSPTQTVVRMCQSLVEQLAAIHTVDLDADRAGRARRRQRPPRP